MTVTDTTPLDVRALTEDELLDLARCDGTAAARALAEAGRRDRDDRLPRERRTLADIRAEGDRQAYAAYRAAGRTELCQATLLSRQRGTAASLAACLTTRHQRGIREAARQGTPRGSTGRRGGTQWARRRDRNG